MHCRRVTKALYDYDAQGDEELSIREGDILLVTDDADQEWWTAVQKPTDTFGDARQGLVPATYVEEVSFAISSGGNCESRSANFTVCVHILACAFHNLGLLQQ